MSTITSTTSQPPKMTMQERLQKELKSEVSSGAVSSNDANALTDALSAIDETMSSDTSAKGAADAPKSPDEMKAKIQGLIDDQVKAGTITSDQASELTKLFENAAPKEGAGGPPPPDGRNANGASSTDSSSSDSSDVLSTFLEALKSSSSGASYAADGSTGSNSTSSLVLDTTA